MFGHVPQKGELGLDATADEAEVYVDEYDPDEFEIITDDWPRDKNTPETIRALMHRYLAELREASELPWRKYKLRFITGLVPYWAEWLKGGEGDGLMAEYKVELDRLGAPADLVAPNWRELWNLAA